MPFLSKTLFDAINSSPLSGFIEPLPVWISDSKGIRCVFTVYTSFSMIGTVQIIA